MSNHVALLCDLNGRVLEVLRAVDELAPLRPGTALVEVVDEGSRAKVRAFLNDLQATDHAAGWEVIVPIQGKPVPFVLAGARHGDRLLILASGSDSSLVELVDDLARINNEQSNALRDALKAASGAPSERDLFLEMSRLNSELSTTQRELTRQNIHLQRLIREKNELLGMVAHDLRNPLAAIFGIAEQLAGQAGQAGQADQAGQAASERRIDMLGHLQDSSRHLLDQIEDLLDLTTFEAGVIRLDLEPTDLRTLVERSLRLARELARDKAITIDIELLDADAPQLRAAALDPHKITQALTNLLTNAIKFSPAGARVLLRLEGRGDSVLISVQDHGLGIAPGRLSGLFEPFQAGQPGTRGERSTGLGLAIVRRVIRAHGGEVQVESTLGSGTTFTLTLPLRSLAPAAGSTGASAAGATPATGTPPGLRVLIADDDPIMTLILARSLEGRGHHVVSVEDAEAAIERLSAASFDLVIVDLEMPGGGGTRVAQHLRRHPPAPPIVALSAHSAARAGRFAGSSDFDQVYAKPFRAADLDDILARARPPAAP